MKKIKKELKRLFSEEDGQSLSEYALVLAVIVIAVIAILATLKDQIVALFQKIIDALKLS